MKISLLSKTESYRLTEVIKEKWPSRFILPKVKTIKVYELEQGKRILKYDKITAIQISDNIILPFLGDSNLLRYFPCVVVDMGAVKFICNGAKILRPGITKFDFFGKGDIVTVKDLNFSKTIAAGIAIQDSETASRNPKGYVIDNLHYISDKFWEAYKEIDNKF